MFNIFWDNKFSYWFYYSTDGTESPILVETDGDAHTDKPRIKYGELVILG